MSWLDHVIAVPAVGIMTEPSFARVAKARDAVSELLDEIAQQDGSPTVQMDGQWALDIHSPKGFWYKIRPDNLTVQFQYGLTSDREPDELPAFEVRDRRTYGDLLGDAIGRLDGLLRAVVADASLGAMRIGIMATATLKRDAPPPGVEALIQYLTRPFRGPLIKCNSTLLAILEESDSVVDRCHHMLVFDDTQGSALQFRLDWQRVMRDVAPQKRSAIVKLLNECQERAIAYFEGVAEGELSFE